MEQEIAKKWSAALKSEKFQQGKGRLRHGDKFCCLGVLCQLAIENGIHVEMTALRPDIDTNSIPYSYGQRSFYLPEDVKLWANMRDERGLLLNGDNLDELNDTGATFLEIANIIDEKWSEL